jgi:UDP-3-O-acyl-N-acetylglucosamine deacetylase
MLDLIGDLTLIGRPLFKMRIEAERLGHAHNVEFAKRLDEAAKSLRKSKTHPVEAQ